MPTSPSLLRCRCGHQGLISLFGNVNQIPSRGKMRGTSSNCSLINIKNLIFWLVCLHSILPGAEIDYDSNQRN